MGKASLSVIIILIAILVFPTPHAGLASGQIKVTFISPSPRTKYPFWNDYIVFMETAAESLGIDLTVLEATSRFDVVDKAREALSHADKPDYLTFIYLAQTGLPVLKAATEAEVYTLITNTDVLPEERIKVGWPRGKFKRWIGHISPDDRQAGCQLMTKLLERGEELGLRSNDGIIRVGAVGGNLIATSAIFRRQGMENAINGTPNTTLERFVLAYWSREKAKEKMTILFDLYDDLRVVWAVNDNTAFGTLDAMDSAGILPGKTGVTGGIDWSSEGIKAVKEKRMEATIGGHFMEGAWALVLLYDHFHGKDFAEFGTTLKSQMQLLDSSNIDTYAPVLDRNNWKKIDFKKFTRVHNPTIERYDFSPDAIAQELIVCE